MKLTPKNSLEWIASRRSVFPNEFDEEAVGKDEIARLLEAARWAPTHKVIEPWSFVVFMGEAKAALAETQAQALFNQKGRNEDTEMKARKFELIASRASAVVAIVLRRDPLQRIPRHEEEWAIAAAVENIHLHAGAFDIGMYWSTGASKGRPEVNALLKVGEDDLHMGWMYIGRYRDRKELIKQRRSVEEYTDWR